jgi:hypothetical protein
MFSKLLTVDWLLSMKFENYTTVKNNYCYLLSQALQPSAGYGLLWLCSPARAMASCGSTDQRGLWPPVALQPSAGYGLLWLCSPARAMASCGSAAQCGLWPPVALQPSAGYGLLWLCSPARAMASCGAIAQRGLWPPVALQPSAGYGLLVHEVSWSPRTTRHSR